MSAISFFSYKGGSGRTTTTLNTLYYLIREVRPTPSSPLVIIDADNESYGMSMLVKEQKKSYPPEQSLQGLALCAKQDAFPPNGNPTDWRSYTGLAKYFTPVGAYFTKDVEPDAVLLLRSDVTPSDQYYAFGNVFNMNDGGTEYHNINAAIDCLSRCNSTIVFDTPSGTQDMATFSLNHSDTIVCCMRPSVQFGIGTRLCFEKLMEGWAKDRDRKNIIFCPSAVPFRETVVDGNAYPAYYKQTAFADFREEMEAKAYDTHGVVRLVWNMQEGEVPGIPEVERFKWQECCLPKTDSDREDERMAKDKYEKLAKLLMRCNG